MNILQSTQYYAEYAAQPTNKLARQIRELSTDEKFDAAKETMTMETATSCVFCRILKGELNPGVVAFRDSQTAVFPSRSQQPRNRGHMLVVPIRHVAQILKLTAILQAR